MLPQSAKNELPARVLAFIEEAAKDLKPMVDEIESSLPTTRNHYGRYMSILSKLAGDDTFKLQVMLFSLLEAGANADGLNDAKAAMGF